MTTTPRMIDVDSTDEQIVDFLTRVKASTPADVAIATDLARVLAASGESFNLPSGCTADVASTGAPSSLTTLLCPLYLRAAGMIVPKLGVPGRPAGGIDCLAQLDGYKVELAPNELRSVLAHAGYAHFLASGRYAPLDARVFKLRQRSGTQDVPTLVAASLLAKKCSVGVQRAGLDIRVAPHGNFGTKWEDAHNNAKLFMAVARQLGLDAYPVLTDARFPYQPFIGRKEALVAMAHVFDETSSRWLNEHNAHCLQISLAATPAGARKLAASATPADLERYFLSNLEAQGADASQFRHLVRRTVTDHRYVLYASADGFACYSLEGIRSIFVSYQSSLKNSNEVFSDPIGLMLLKSPGEWMEKGEPVATVRVDPGYSVEQVTMSLQEYVCRTTDVPFGPTIEGITLYE
ncbi:MAG: hypothetical protein ROZ09_05740 [Thiobacillus sp.]|uniref:hypothetical protein n=1 Tax=Thiobacillus sp. TaxID=924 RepID=UPI0028947CC2|nr:hypothetical protein [Thiobacillus sp.]MDT3706309.1 hypothetical protein [Thiobacillus sp.]